MIKTYTIQHQRKSHINGGSMEIINYCNVNREPPHDNIPLVFILFKWYGDNR